MPAKEPNLTPRQRELIRQLFEKMLDTADPEAVLAREPDVAVVRAASVLWDHHARAEKSAFLENPIELVPETASELAFQFSPGQALAGRFTIQELLGFGGMGEVYRALDGALQETVAIKTIRSALSSDPDVRRRFIAEIQNARRVTHPNVCRINDLFEENEIPFFSMEYLDGLPLAQWLSQVLLSAKARRQIAVQLAAALHAAHRNGVLHCDFKPGNIILTGSAADFRACITDFGLARAAGSTRPSNEAADPISGSLQAGTLRYMAPELLARSAPPSVRTDVYSFGVVLSELVPGSALAARCSSPDPGRRPESMARVIDSLEGKTTRRIWLGAGIVTAASISGYAIYHRPKAALGLRRKLAVSAFRPGELRQAAVLRDLLSMALRQSPLLSVMGDDQLGSLLRDSQGQKIEWNPSEILRIAGRAEIGLVLDGLVKRTAAGLSLVIQAFVPGESAPAVEVARQVDDAGKLAPLADRVAVQLRREFGESDGSLRALYTPLEQVTSASPEAIDLYFRGVALSESGHAGDAQTLLEQAVLIDPQFALAHLRLGMARAAHDNLASCLESYARAFALSGRLSRREKLWIESRYYNITGDYVSALDRCRSLILLHPDEATFRRHVAFAYARLGRAAESLPHNQRAVELDPSNIHNRSEWMVNAADANRPDEALALYARFRSDGITTPLLEWGAGLAHMARGDFDVALRCFDALGAEPDFERWARWVRCGPLVLSGRFAEAASALASDLAYDVAANISETRDIRRSWLASVYVLQGTPHRARDLTAALAQLDPSPITLDRLREGALIAMEIQDTDAATAILERLAAIERQWPSTHTRGVRAHIESQLLAAQHDPRSAGLLDQARGLWADPLTLLSVSEQQASAGDFAAELNTIAAIEAQRGRIFSDHFPGLVVRVAIKKARCLARLSRFAESQRLYRQILNQWEANAGSYPIVQDLRVEFSHISRITGDEKHG